MDIYKHFIHFLLAFCFDFVSFLFSLFPYILQTFFALFYRHYKAIFCVHFIDIFCSSFSGNIMKILLTFYLTHFIHVFFLSILRRLCSHFKRFFCVHFKISVNFDWTVRVHVYRHCILQGRYRDFTEIFVSFVMSINGSSFPVRAHKLAIGQRGATKIISHSLAVLKTDWLLTSI